MIQSFLITCGVFVAVWLLICGTKYLIKFKWGEVVLVTTIFILMWIAVWLSMKGL